MVFIQYLYYVLSISRRSLFLTMMMMMMTMNLVFAAGPTGLTLKLIHRDSLYPGNLTKLERMDRAFERSIHRQQKQQKLLSSWEHQMKLQANNSEIDINALRPPVRVYDHTSYMVQLGIGSFSNVGGSPTEPPIIPSYYYFYFDTGSDLLWLQCESSRTGTPLNRTRYFVQQKDIYHGQYSLTYRPIVYKSPNRICQIYFREKVPPEGLNFCGYRMEYADGASSEGVLATETLTVGTEQIKDFVLGCGYRQNEPDFGTKPPGQNHVAGTMGLGGGIASFIVQLGRRGQYRFEYCLREDDGNFDTVTFLRFGSDVKIYSRRGQVVQSTTTVNVRGETLEYVTILGISVGGEPVVYPAGSNVFGAKLQERTGGCAFDSGTDLLELSGEVYNPFRDHLVNLFRVHGTAVRIKAEGRWSGYDLCFRKTPSFNGLPSIVFHFSEAIFEIAPEVAFVSDRRSFCLTIPRSKLRYPLSVVFGSRHLVNHRILHNVYERKISWINEDCSKDP